MENSQAIKKIEFKPTFSTMNITAKDIENAIYQSLSCMQLDGFNGVKINIKNTMLDISIAFRANSKLVVTDPIKVITEQRCSMKPSDELVKTLKGLFLEENDEVVAKQIKNLVIIELNPMKTLNTIIGKDDNGVYQIGGLFPMGNSGLIQITRMEKDFVEKSLKMIKNQGKKNNNQGKYNKNNNHHNNNNRNHNGNGYRNSNNRNMNRI